MIGNCCGCSAASTSFLQARDRDLIVPDTSKHKALWPILDGPAPTGTEIVGTWRPKTPASSSRSASTLENPLEAEPQTAGARS